MEKFILLLFDLGWTSMLLLIGFISFMIIQGITYKLTGFSIYNYINKILWKEVR